MHERDRRPQHGSTPQIGHHAVPAAVGKYTLLDTLPAPMPLSPPRPPPPRTRSDEVLVSQYETGTNGTATPPSPPTTPAATHPAPAG